MQFCCTLMRVRINIWFPCCCLSNPRARTTYYSGINVSPDLDWKGPEVAKYDDVQVLQKIIKFCCFPIMLCSPKMTPNSTDGTKVTFWRLTFCCLMTKEVYFGRHTSLYWITPLHCGAAVSKLQCYILIKSAVSFRSYHPRICFLICSNLIS